jgi:Flp pilus assembly protein TadD
MSPVAKPTTLASVLKAGYAALTTGMFDRAASMAKLALETDSKLVPAHFLAGLVAINTNDKNVAFQAFQSVVRLDRNHAGGWAQLALIYMQFGMVNKAENAIQQLRIIRTDEPMALDLMGQALSLMGEHTLANKCFARTCIVEPNNPVFMHNLANNLIFSGDTQGAQTLLKDIISIKPNSPQAHWLLAGSKKAEDKTHINSMQKWLEETPGNAHAQAFYHYAIGKEYEDLKQWSNAFEAFENGAKAKKQVAPFDEADEIAAFEFLQQHFTQDWLNDGCPGSNDAAPIFVLGQPRTGTTLIERIITAHTSVHSAGELQQLRLAIFRLGNINTRKRFSTQVFDAALKVEPKQIGNMYMQTVGRMRGNTERFVDKLPQNYLFLPLILKALPNAKVVHVVRNPMDACFASYKQLFAETYAHSYDQQQMARHHVRYLHLMSVWRERFGDRFLDIQYEDTAQDLESNARTLLKFLELPWQDQCLNFHQQKGAVTTASAVQVREPAHTRSIGRWKHYEQQLAPMLDTLSAAGVEV